MVVEYLVFLYSWKKFVYPQKDELSEWFVIVKTVLTNNLKKRK